MIIKRFVPKDTRCHWRFYATTLFIQEKLTNINMGQLFKTVRFYLRLLHLVDFILWKAHSWHFLWKIHTISYHLDEILGSSVSKYKRIAYKKRNYKYRSSTIVLLSSSSILPGEFFYIFQHCFLKCIQHIWRLKKSPVYCSYSLK